MIHLDEYRHLPGTQWVERPDADFERMHDEAMSADRWVIDGNYSRWLPDRLRRATGLVLWDASTGASIVRYLDRVRLEMVRFMLGPARRNRLRHRHVFDEFERPKVFLPDRAALEQFSRRNDMARRSH